MPRRPSNKMPRYPPGIFTSRRIVRRLARFQNLVRHDQKWAHQMPFAADLATLIPPDTPPDQQSYVIRRLIAEMLPAVYWDLQMVGIPIDFELTKQSKEFDPDKKAYRNVETKQAFNLISDYSRLPGGQSVQSFDSLISALDQGVGAYKNYEAVAIRRKFNPLTWIAFVVSIPIRVLDDAGLGDGTESKLLTAYGWVIQTLWGVFSVSGILKFLKLLPTLGWF